MRGNRAKNWKDEQVDLEDEKGREIEIEIGIGTEYKCKCKLERDGWSKVDA